MRRAAWCHYLLASGSFGWVAAQSSSIVEIGGLPINISGLPTCAQSCLANSTGSANGCSITDTRCLCSSINYINELSCCLQRSCSTADQEAALRFDISLCEQYNVSIPDFIGCSPLQSESASGSASFTSIPATQLSSFISVLASAAASVSVSTITAIAAAYTTTNEGTITDYSGSALLTGSCTTPTILTYAPFSNGAFIEFPWVGCQPQNPDCCPFDYAAAGPLTVCPSDYITTSSACCPSGWSVYTTALYAGQTPCYSAPAEALAAASLPASSQATPRILTTQLFTLRYDLAPSSPRLSSGAIGGIAIGAVAGSIGLGALALLLRRKLHKRATLRRDASIVQRSPTDTVAPMTQTLRSSDHFTVGGGSAGTPSVSPTTPRSKHSTAGVVLEPHARPELPSLPIGGANLAKGIAGPGGPPLESPRTPVEMPGSTFIHEHHPVFGAGGRSGQPPTYQPPGGAGSSAGGLAVEVTSPGGTTGEGETYRPPFASEERISGTYKR